MVRPVCQPDGVEQGSGPVTVVTSDPAVEMGHDLELLYSGERPEQVRALKDEPDIHSPGRRPAAVRGVGEDLAGDGDLTTLRTAQEAGDRHEGRLAGP